MKNITLSAEEHLIDRARERAARDRTTLNSVFRKWLATYAGPIQSRDEIREAFRQFDDVVIGRKFSRDEMNER